ncbi:MAG: hypothetical protein IT559_05560 [Alphaproteobacteria bacterium]|nr:hypothetical protein [Alphaproteobacteria bacterium]
MTEQTLGSKENTKNTRPDTQQLIFVDDETPLQKVLAHSFNQTVSALAFAAKLSLTGVAVVSTGAGYENAAHEMGISPNSSFPALWAYHSVANIPDVLRGGAVGLRDIFEGTSSSKGQVYYFYIPEGSKDSSPNVPPENPEIMTMFSPNPSYNGPV